MPFNLGDYPEEPEQATRKTRWRPEDAGQASSYPGESYIKCQVELQNGVLCQRSSSEPTPNNSLVLHHYHVSSKTFDNTIM